MADKSKRSEEAEAAPDTGRQGGLLPVRPESEEPTRKLDLPTARIVDGYAYGPGQGVDVPESVADFIENEQARAAGQESATRRGGRKAR